MPAGAGQRIQKIILIEENTETTFPRDLEENALYVLTVKSLQSESKELYIGYQGCTSWIKQPPNIFPLLRNTKAGIYVRQCQSTIPEEIFGACDKFVNELGKNTVRAAEILATSGTTASIARVLGTLKKIEETATLISIPAAGAVLHASSSVLITTAWGASQFLGGGVPVIGMVDAALTFAEALNRLVFKFTSDQKFGFAAYGEDIGDLLSLPVLIRNYKAWDLYQAGGIWQPSLVIAAQGYAIKAAYDFIKAAIVLSCSKKVGVELNEQRRDLLLQGLKLIGFTLLACGPACFTAGFTVLAMAAAVALYHNSERVQAMVDPVLNLFKCKGLTLCDRTIDSPSTFLKSR